MSFVATLVSQLSHRHLLKHPFYEAWSAGKLTLESLGTYAEQYYHHVVAFPSYVSATHSGCESVEGRQLLVDEDRGPQNHPELWLRFSEGVGATRGDVKGAALEPETQALINTFLDLSRASYAEGLGALFAYENQIPAVAATKIKGLKEFYGVDGEHALKFFSVQPGADVYHSETCAQLLEQLPPDEKAKAQAAAQTAAQALWAFLDGMCRVSGVECDTH